MNCASSSARKSPSATVALYYDASPAHAPSARDRKKMIELPERVSTAYTTLVGQGLVDRCECHEAREATDAELLRAHRPDHLIQVREWSAEARAANGNVYYSVGADHAARLACGAVIDATLRALDGGPRRAFALVRPPGHHASRDGFEGDYAEGGCFFNSVAVAAACARAHGVDRVAIVDWDVHHGNGTQEIFYGDASVLFISLHADLYPGTGPMDETGEVGTPAAGRTVNVMWPDPLRYPPADHAEYAAALELLVLPILRAFEPGLLLISSGFDAARGEAFRLNLAPETYARMTAALMGAIPASVPLVAALEGGYNPASVGACCSAVLRALLGDPVAAPPPPARLKPRCEHALLCAVREQEPAWAPHVSETAAAVYFDARRACPDADAGEGRSHERKRPRGGGV
jgi:acetoin utilization deacetylase AcuC-like enzyme